MIEPRKYQIEAVNAIIEAQKRGVSRQLVSLPTGTGKTIVFGLLARRLGVRTLILVHREEYTPL
jgi:superfamily II DNA or RNA helicase